MPDSIFFPTAGLLAAAFIFMAIQPYADRPPSGPVSAANRDAQDVTVNGRELHRFRPGEAADLQVEVDEAGDDGVIVITRLADDFFDDPRQGPHLVLAEDLEQAFESRPIEVTVEARSTDELGAEQFEINYLARAGVESGWTVFDLTPDFQPYTLAYDTPPRGDSIGYDFLGIRPVTPGQRRSMEVRSVRIRAAGPKQRPETD